MGIIWVSDIFELVHDYDYNTMLHFYHCYYMTWYDELENFYFEVGHRVCYHIWPWVFIIFECTDKWINKCWNVRRQKEGETTRDKETNRRILVATHQWSISRTHSVRSGLYHNLNRFSASAKDMRCMQAMLHNQLKYSYRNGRKDLIIQQWAGARAN